MERVAKAFEGNLVLKEVSAELHAGDRVLLRGDNGSGKTTLINILSGFLRPDAGILDFVGQARYSFPLRLGRSFSPHLASRHGIGRTWQQGRLFQSLTLRENIAVASPNQKGENPFYDVFQHSSVHKDDARGLERADNVLTEFGLQGLGSVLADHVSLGQMRRATIARASCAGARILLLDEPLAGLDADGFEQMRVMLAQVPRPAAVVIVEHVLNAPVVMNFVTTVWTLTNGKLLVESAAEVRAKMAGVHSRGWSEHMLGCISALDVRRQSLPGGARLTIASRLPERLAPPVLEVRDLVVKRGHRMVIGDQDSEHAGSGLSFSLRKGDIAVLEAPNGWGKTTLLEAICGILPVSRGELRLNGHEIRALPVWKRARSGLTFLRANNSLFSTLTVKELLRLTAVPEAKTVIRPLLSRKVGSLSSGERHLVALSSLPWASTGVALLDEPLLSLDLSGVKSFERDLINNNDCACVLAVPSYRGGSL